MRRADRLFQIVQILRRGAVVTAAALAEELEVSPRTIYRDVNDLLCSGVPIDAEAGVGYLMGKGYDLPPLMFTHDEIEALALGAKTVAGWAGSDLADASKNALAKIEAVLPASLKTRVSSSPLHALNFRPSGQTTQNLSALRPAIHENRKVYFKYTRLDGQDSVRTVRPLGLAFIAPAWLLTAWCELRKDFRNFRVDRMTGIQVLEERFEEESGKNWEDFLRSMR